MKNYTIKLSSDGMGEASEADFDAYANYVASRIDDLTGLDITVEQARYGDTVSDWERFGHSDGADNESIRDALSALWDEFCADPSLWPTDADGQPPQEGWSPLRVK